MQKGGFLKSITFNRFILLLCGIYIGMVLFIHSRLQADRPPQQIDNDSKSEYQLTEKLDLSDLKTWVNNKKELNQLSKDISDLERKVYQAKKQVDGLKKQNENPKSSNCLQHSNEGVKNSSFKILEQGVYVFSAYLDDRKPNVFIRLMVLLEKTKKKVPIFCHINSVIIIAKQYEMCENHNKPFGGYIYSCELPRNMSNPCPLHVSTVYASSASSEVALPIIPVKPLSKPQQFGICISPLFGSVKKEKIVEFIELSQVLGANHFYFYDNNISAEMKMTLNYYEQKNIVTVVPWDLPSVIFDNKIWYHGQLIAHNDCLYRSMSTLQHVLFNDIDEFVIPHTSAKYWKNLFPSVFKDQYCGIAFSSAFYDPAIGVTHPSGLQTMSITGRTKLFSHVRTKIMVKPQRVFEVGIHHVSKQNEEKWSVQKFKPEVAYLHHYRKCIGNYGMKCSQFEKDTTIFSYYDELKDRFDFSMREINKFSSALSPNVTQKVV
ncbi:beta-1,4-galactosyltransferase galt-1 [Patella vulgata]|uniref:beta-1,4-galactosyltransferase galt-1 n=1 Tax=Patella vulgata TaxID=6465 RepID=UPI00217FF991|nr:beta-1,4-galactosyltransferase galt-1 [Patella vulgata]XP_050394739.1 beta-1,4-galactosyltransferase galt-1 [Patella vulgata]